MPDIEQLFHSGDGPEDFIYFLTHILHVHTEEIDRALRKYSKADEPLLSWDHLYGTLVLKLARLYQKKPRVNRLTGGYCTKIIRNSFIDFHRARKRQWWLACAPDTFDQICEESTSNPVLRKEQFEQLIKGLETEEQKTAIRLFCQNKYSYAEIAEEMGKTVGAVTQLIFRARRQIGKKLANTKK